MSDYPHQLSGGMRQRVMIAMALANDPRLLIADEPTTALDVTIQAQILDLIRTLQDETGTAVLLITHDLGVVAEVGDDVAVMYAGRIVEQAAVADLFADPQHPYTLGLLSSIPRLDADLGPLPTIRGSVPGPADMPAGCRFSTRCPFADEHCRAEEPPLADIAGRATRSPAGKRRLKRTLPEKDPPAMAPVENSRNILEVDGLKKYFPTFKALLARRRPDRQGGGRRQLQRGHGRNAGHRGRERVRQVHPGAADPAPDRPDGRDGQVPRAGHRQAAGTANAPAAGAYADDLPGPLRLPQSTDERRRYPDRADDRP